MKDLYAHPSQPANLYASRAQDLKAHHLRLAKELGSGLGLEVPPKVLAALESRPAADQPPVLFADVVPAPMRPHLRGFPAPFPRGPIGPGSPGASIRPRVHGADAEMHDRVQQQMREAQGARPGPSSAVRPVKRTARGRRSASSSRRHDDRGNRL